MNTPNTARVSSASRLRGANAFGAAWFPMLRLILVVSGLFAPWAAAQCPGDWLPGAASGFSGTINVFAVLPGGDAVAGGFFTHLDGAPANRIARYNPATGAWSTLGSGVNDNVLSLAVLPGGDLIVGGEFTSAGSQDAGRVARYNSASSSWSTLGSGVSGVTFPSVNALAILPGGDMIVGGQFTTAGGVPASRIARFNPVTGGWSALGPGVSWVVQALAVLPGGDLIVGGWFTFAGGSPANFIARYNPVTGAWSAMGSGMNDNVRSLAILPDGDVIAGGDFTSAGGVAVNKIARYNFASGAWSALGSGIGGSFPIVDALLVLPGGDVIVGGEFTSAGGVPASRIARYNPATGAWSALGPGVGAFVGALAVLPGGDLIAGGNFTTAGGHSSRYFARYAFAGPPPTIADQPDPQTTCPSAAATFAITASGTAPFTYQWQIADATVPGGWADIANGTVFTAGRRVGTFTGSRADTLLAGDFYGGPGIPTIDVPVLLRCIVSNACGSAVGDAATLTVCVGDTDDGANSGTCDGGVTIDDLLYYLNILEMGISSADVDDGSFTGTPDGGVTIDDLLYYLVRFEAGC